MNVTIAKTAFLTGLISYGVFLLFEYLRPGFVQYVFSVHWFLLAVIGTGIWLAVVAKDQKSTNKLWRLVQLIVGLLLMIVMLREGEVFGDFRIDAISRQPNRSLADSKRLMGFVFSKIYAAYPLSIRLGWYRDPMAANTFLCR